MIIQGHLSVWQLSLTGDLVLHDIFLFKSFMKKFALRLLKHA